MLVAKWVILLARLFNQLFLEGSESEASDASDASAPGIPIAKVDYSHLESKLNRAQDERKIQPAISNAPNDSRKHTLRRARKIYLSKTCYTHAWCNGGGGLSVRSAQEQCSLPLHMLRETLGTQRGRPEH